MSRVCLFVVLFLVLNITVQFGDCEDTMNTTVNCDEQVSFGSDQNRLSDIEWFLMFGKWFANCIKNIIDNFKNDKVFATSINSIIRTQINFHMIFPGTFWCGYGDIAKDKDNLGKFNKTDACCRTHDICNNYLSASETRVNLKNNGIFTRSACICDNAFYDCLKDVNSVPAREVGKMYFNILRPQCFQCVCPTDNCNPPDSSKCKNQCDRYIWIDSRSF